MIYDTIVIDSIFGQRFYLIMVLSSTLVLYNIDSSILHDSMMLLSNADQG